MALFLARAPLSLAVIALVGSALFLGIIIQPAAGLVVLALAIPFGGVRPLPLPGLTVVDLLVGLTLVAWLAAGVRRRAIVLQRPALTWPVLLMAWAFALSLTQASSWREGVPEWLKWAEFAALYIGAAQLLKPRHLPWLLGALFVAGVAQAAIGAYQFVRQAGPDEFVLMGRFMRAYGTFRQPNPYAGYLGYLAPVAASLAVGALVCWRQGKRTADLLLLLLTGGVAIVLAAGIGMSWSRGSWLGLAGSLLVVAALRSRRTALLVGGALGVGLLVIALFGTGWLPASITGRLVNMGGLAVGDDPARTEITDDNFAVLERLAHWQAAQRMFDDHPSLGVGIGNYAVTYPQYALPHWYEPLGHAHNVYLNFLAETGVVGFGSFALFWLAAAWVAWRSARRAAGYRAALALGVLGTLTYCTIHNLFDNLFVAHMQLQLALLLASLSADAA